MTDEQTNNAAAVLEQTVKTLHTQYGPSVAIDQVIEWLCKNEFKEIHIEPAPRFADLPKTKFTRADYPLEYSVLSTRGYPADEFAILIASGKDYMAYLHLNDFTN